MVGNNAWQAYTKESIERDHPNLLSTEYKVTSADTIDYNCVAWAAEDPESWWWPDSQNEGYWPPEVPRQETLEAFHLAFQTIGYQVCQDGDLENGFQKIAIYCLNGKPTHVARQLPTGKWTSKLGQYEDIEHTLAGLTGDKYGHVLSFLKKRFNIASSL